MRRKDKKVLVFLGALALCGCGAVLLWVARQPDEFLGGEPLGWLIIPVVIVGLLGLAAVGGAMVIIISAFLPHALNAPDADELRRDTTRPPSEKN